MDPERAGWLQVQDALPDYRMIGWGQLPVKEEFITRGRDRQQRPHRPSQLPDQLPHEIKEHLFETLLMRGVAEYEALIATGRHEFPVPWLGDEVRIMQRVLPGLSSAARLLPSNAIAGMLDQVRNRILQFSLEIEQENPDAGEAEPGSVPVAESTVTNIFNNTIHGGTNVMTAARRDATVTVTTTKIDAVWPDLEARLGELDSQPPRFRSSAWPSEPRGSWNGARTSYPIMDRATRDQGDNRRVGAGAGGDD